VRYFGFVLGVKWWFLTDILGQTFGSLLKGLLYPWRWDRQIVPKRR